MSDHFLPAESPGAASAWDLPVVEGERFVQVSSTIMAQLSSFCTLADDSSRRNPDSPCASPAASRERKRRFAGSSDGGRPVATHLLLETQELDDSRLLIRGHMSRENPRWRTLDPDNEVLANFQGPHAYVSAGWYSVDSAPTWNYLSVHVYGRPRLIEDRGELYAMLMRLVDSQERRYPEASRYTIESLPSEILEGMMNGVAGIEITVTRVEAASKLSQNRSARDYENIINRLRTDGSAGPIARQNRVTLLRSAASRKKRAASHALTASSKRYRRRERKTGASSQSTRRVG